MFDKSIFDGTRFDRESNDSYEGRIHGEGGLICAPELIYNFNSLIFSGQSGFSLFLAPFSKIDSFGSLIGDNTPEQYNTGGNLELVLVMEMSPSFFGAGNIDAFNIGNIITNILSFRGISLKPNETITIDTDAMTVLFGLEHDVSSLTNDSSFFDLNEGTNELTFEIGYEVPPDPMPAHELDTTIIWQNRWL